MREPIDSSIRPHDVAATLGAGGVVALGAKLPDDQRTSPVTARAYAHPALDGKTIVRLEPDAVAAGVDAEMAAFGFDAPDVGKPLGRVRYRTLGFPAWALVHEPKKAKAALDVTEDLRRAKRMVAAKPGHAKDAFEKIAKQLQRSAPQFLPSFWEECGRVVADQASSTMAAQCFERARQAERAFKLKIDPDDGDAVFVEFALLGALSAKTLSQYARDLKKSEGGKEAYRRFRAIAVKRALGGMPPWSGMGKDVRALAAEAELDVDREDDALVAELIEAPAIAKAPGEFWTTYRDALIRLGRVRVASPTTVGRAAPPEAVRSSIDLRTRLRALWPEPRGGSREAQRAFTASWIELLDEVGALGDLPDDGLGAWVSRLLKYAGKTPRVVALLRELAPRLATQPIAVVTPRSRWGVDLDLDLAELALELGIPLVDPADGDDFAPDLMTCDPVRVAAEPRYARKLVAAVASMMGESEHEHRMRGKQGFVAARRRWIEERLERLAKAALPGVADELDLLDGKTTAETFLPYPDLHERLARLDAARALATELRGGLVDEFGWPAYEDAFARLGGEISIGGAFPVMTIWNKAKAIAVGAAGVLAEHDLVYKPTEHSIAHVLYVGGQFLVDLDPVKGWKHVAYWSDTPKQPFEFQRLRTWGGDLPTATTLPDGSVTLGDKAFRPGDTHVVHGRDYLYDGVTLWTPEWDSGKQKLRELDPVKGAKGRLSWPAWLDGWHRDGWTIAASKCVLLPAPAGLDASPLGIAGGMLGLKIRTQDADDDVREVERIDGVTRTGGIVPFALVSMPGDPAPRPIVTTGADNKRFPGGSGPGVHFYAPDDEPLAELNANDWAARGWGAVHVPPASFWDFLRPRDPAGSQALRAVTDATALLDAARRDVAAAPDDANRAMTATEAAVRQALPAITDAKLVRGVAGVAIRAAELAARLAAIAGERAKENADPGGEGLTGEGAKLRKLAGALATGRAIKIADFELDVRDWLTHGRAKAALALSPIGSADERRAARDMVRALAGTVLADDLSRCRVFKIEAPDDYEDPEAYDTLVVTTREGSVYAIHATDDWAIELSTDGSFRPPPPWIVGDETRLARGIGTDWAHGFLELPDAPVAWTPEIASRLAARAGLTEPEATLLYLGCPSGWKKDFLGKDKRAVVGLKLNDADAASTMFKELDRAKLDAVFARAVPDDARLLATPLADGGYLDRLGDAWRASFGKRAKIPQDLIAAAKKDLDLGNDLAKYLPVFAGDDDVWFLEPDLRPLPELGGWRDEKGLTPDTARELVTLAAWLFVARPVGDPLRAGIPKLVKRLRALADDPRVVWKLRDRWFADEPKAAARRQAIVDMVGGESIALPRRGDHEATVARDDGAIVLAVYNGHATAGFRPAKLDGAARKKVETLAHALHDEEEGGDPLADVKLVGLLRSDGLAALAARVADTDVAGGGYEANPLVSAKKLVGKVVKAHGVSDDAAALFLQLLALAEPTQKSVCEWNGWTPKQYKAAAAELASKKLVVEGKRERAGREVFVKGGYAKGDGKNLPMEEWKLPFYAVLGRHLPTEPLHALFARAWKRIEDGDAPA